MAEKSGKTPDRRQFLAETMRYAALGVFGAIGGITLENVDEVLDAGAESIAVCAAVTKVADPGNACKAMKAKILEGRGVLGV